MKVTRNQPKKKKVVITSLIFTMLGIFFILFGWVTLGNFVAFAGILILINLFVSLSDCKNKT
jgi:hypothetical protein